MGKIFLKNVGHRWARAGLEMIVKGQRCDKDK
jgi:hypothetical protein